MSYDAILLIPCVALRLTPPTTHFLTMQVNVYDITNHSTYTVATTVDESRDGSGVLEAACSAALLGFNQLSREPGVASCRRMCLCVVLCCVVLCSAVQQGGSRHYGKYTV
jgi:hypothetical protein